MDTGSAGDPHNRDEPDDQDGSQRAGQGDGDPGNGGGGDKDAERLILFIEVMALVGDEPASAAGLAALILTYLVWKLR